MDKKDNYNYSKETMDYYNELKKKSNSPFSNMTFGDIFIFSIAISKFKNLTPQPLNNKQPNIPKSATKKYEWLLNSLCIENFKDAKILLDEEKCQKLLEEYANAGIKLLYDEVFNKPGDFFKRMFNLIKNVK